MNPFVFKLSLLEYKMSISTIDYGRRLSGLLSWAGRSKYVCHCSQMIDQFCIGCPRQKIAKSIQLLLPQIRMALPKAVKRIKNRYIALNQEVYLKT
jgi:hypothetical protein